MTDAIAPAKPAPKGMWTSIKKYVSEIFQDVDGGYSMKRALLFVFAAVFVVVTIYVVHFGVAVHEGQKTVFAIPQETLDFLKTVLGYCMDGIKWLGALVLGERLPQGMAALRGNHTPDVTAHDDGDH